MSKGNNEKIVDLFYRNFLLEMYLQRRMQNPFKHLKIQRIQREPIFFKKKKMTCHKVTNLSNRGLISEDRSTKATLPFTIPRSIFKSSA